jgi:hypothetical protein
MALNSAYSALVRLSLQEVPPARIAQDCTAVQRRQRAPHIGIAILNEAPTAALYPSRFEKLNLNDS